ncbi:hypothetical protein KHQ81_06310 [Mycoplasmatota bacterium]|nr:hypothetical protein KHQ81_06310 [Mycoplasmatota bacterium]
MIDKFRAQNFINRGKKIDNKLIYSLIIINIVIVILALIIQLMNNNQLFKLFIINMFVVYILFNIYSLIFQKVNIKRNILLCSISSLFLLLIMNILIYSVLQYSNFFIFISILIQFIILISCIKIMKIIARNKKNKVYKSKIYEYTFGYGIAFLIVKNCVNISEENSTVVLTIVFHIVYIIVYYILAEYIMKLYFACKFDINEYSN